MYKFGEVILARVQYVDTFEIKPRPAVVLFEEFGNIVCAGITSNLEMEGIPLSKSEGAITDSIIKLNSIVTVSEEMVSRKLFHLSEKKKRLLKEEFIKRLSQ